MVRLEEISCACGARLFYTSEHTMTFKAWVKYHRPHMMKALADEKASCFDRKQEEKEKP